MKKLFTFFLFVFIATTVSATDKIDILREEGCKFLNMNQWKDCNNDKDCVVVFDFCGRVSTVNAKYVEENGDYNQCMGPMIDCPGFDKNQDKQKAQVACVKNKCVLLESKR